MIELIAFTAGLSGFSSIKFFPSSHALASLGSRGTEPKKGTPISSAIFLAPPVEGLKMMLSPLQLGHTNPDMFSTTPITPSPIFLQKLISFLTSKSATLE